ncbi:hypothetical protein GCM10029964_002140 [Kibdelosporangium lantanae]
MKRSTVRTPTRPFHRRLVRLLLTLVMLLVGAPVAHAAPADYLQVADQGDPQHIPVLMFRQRHTVLTEGNGNPDTFVSYARNVAEFEWVDAGGTHWVVVAPAVSRWEDQSRIALIDLYHRDANGDLHLVDPAGNPLLEKDGTPVDWRTSATPSYAWDLSQETDPEIVKALRSGQMHSERTAYWFLRNRMNGANNLVHIGLSEKIPCNRGSNCQAHVKSEWFPEIEPMKFLTDQTSRAMLRAKRNSAEAKEKLRNGDSSDTFVENGVNKWREIGMPTDSGTAAKMGGRIFNSSGTSPPQGAGARALAEGVDPGGIDFSTLELRYVSEGGDGRLKYAFDANTGNGKVADGQVAATQSSDAFFVWLSLPPSTFWVNLNPTEPDRIVDARLGTTDVGRILLEADFRMKKVVGRLLHPDSDTGKQFWAAGDMTTQNCVDMRQWIVPKPASVYEDDGGLYIVDAPLEVKMETQYLTERGQNTSCTNPNAAMDKAFRTLVLPKVEDAVNHGPEFAELRRVYMSRVAAEWYREKHGGALSAMVDSGDVSRWPALSKWSPRQVFDQYVESYSKKEFDIHREETISGRRYDVTYTYGGVDFSGVDLDRVASVSQDRRDAVRNSFQNAATDQDGKVWLGSAGGPVRAIDYDGGNEPEDYPDGQVPDDDVVAAPRTGTSTWPLLGVSAVVGLVLVICLRLRQRARRR